MDFHGLIWLLILALTFRYGLPWFFAHQKKKRLAASGIADIDTMGGKAFEEYLEVLFGKLGYKVERTRYIGDYGADLITQKDGVKTVIQAKRYGKAVGIKAVQEAVAAKGMYGCTEAMVVTNSTFTPAAAELARANLVVLWDRDRLEEALLSVWGESRAMQQAPQPPIPQSPPAPQLLAPQLPRPISLASASPTCATCGVRVSEKVQQYCVAHSERFSGAIYCFEHQRMIRRNAA